MPRAILKIVLSCLLGLVIAGSAKAEACRTAVGYRIVQIGGRPVAVWYPTAAQPSEYEYSPKLSGLVAYDAPPTIACGSRVPLVVFSHGDLGCGIQSPAFTEELARNGYVVAAPDHADAAICHTAPPMPGAPHARQPAQPDILNPESWNDTSRVDRRDDIEAVIDFLLGNAEFKAIINAHKIGLAGHSLGGYTVVGIAGGWESWHDPRIGAVLAMSPYVMPFQVKKTLGNVHVPIMYQGGTNDIGITPFLKGPNGAYSATNAPVYFVELRRAAHFAWVNCEHEQTTEACVTQTSFAPLIAGYGIAFFNRYLKDLPEPALKEKDPLLASYEFRLPDTDSPAN
jgi:predicted dienelactone hydrolase